MKFSHYFRGHDQGGERGENRGRFEQDGRSQRGDERYGQSRFEQGPNEREGYSERRAAWRERFERRAHDHADHNHEGYDRHERMTCGPEGRERGFGRGGEGLGREGLGRRGSGMRRHTGGHRPFDQGDLRYVILKLISEKPSYGYEIIKAIEDRLAGAYAPSPGIVYPTLTLLEELGFIKVQETNGPRKLFAITPEGEEALAQNRATVDAIFARMAEINARRGSQQAPQLVRAWENLKTALNLRVGRGPLTEDEIARIATLLDEAAKGIEQA